ncbi:cobalamin B12-binding domain-containing protein [Nocardioides marmoribigeumensis]|uniref:Methanogenic corrinoid protein MtbC1 n=1 Tax=Nocardioides marmoribigeumensis TaxID=433649 RepID=A0ABU2BWH6_9ACTN|nr:cobalamin-dependent protein [Nocardioides marmoribigeumensis]MDR7362158.1 methanogenic corrinoid protein MtbC1 [Nocardioides marmoribigeumensis]
MTSRAEWTSWALARLALSPAQVADRVVRLTGLPDSARAREVVELHLCALDVSLEVGAPDLLVPQLLWETHRWAQVDPPSGGPGVGAAVAFVLGEHLDELTVLSVVRHVEAAEAAAAAVVRRTPSRHEREGLAALSGDAADYLAHAIAGRHDEAIALVEALAGAGWSVHDVLLGLIAPAQEELGRLWERGALSVAQEHMATAVTHLAMYALYPRLAGRAQLGLSLVAATPPGDLHSVGLRMVTDLLQQRGWDVRYVGTSCPVDDVLAAAVEVDASLLLLGASMTCHLPGLRDAVGRVRADPRCDGLTVLVGGRPFREVSGLGRWVGADLTAGDANDALAAVDGLLDPEVVSRP